MSTITKEWLLKTIAELEEERDAVPGAVNEDAAMALAAMKLALASLEAEPIGFAFADDVDLMRKKIKVGGMLTVRHQGEVALYTAPPAPVSVPAAMEMDDDFDSAFEHGKAVGWNAYRAAMLQGAGGNSPVIPDGWVACSERLPPEGYEPDGGAVCYLVWHKNEVDCGPQYSISNVFFLRKHWEKNFTHWMPLPAAPQQEVK